MSLDYLEQEGESYKMIGSGSFGKVFLINDKEVLKKMKFNEDSNIPCHINITEVCFLSSYIDVPFIPKFIKCNVETNDIQLVMEHCGKTLHYYKYNLEYLKRLSILPLLLIQFSRACIWMQNENIIHNDIKLANICINDDNIIKIIDWGFVVKLQNINIEYSNGTENYCDPDILIEKTIDYTIDIYALGLCICEFISKSIYNYEELLKEYKSSTDKDELTESLFDCIFSEENRKYVLLEYGEKGKIYIDILKQMINLNRSKRIKPMDIYNNSIFDDIRDKYPLFDNKNYEITSINYDYVSVNPMLNDNILGIVFNWLIDLSISLNIKCSLINTIKLIYRYIGSQFFDFKELQLITVCCLLINTSINIYEEYVTYNDAYILSFKLYNIEYIKNKTIHILESLNWNIFNGLINCEHICNFTNNKWKKLILTTNIHENKIKYIPSQLCKESLQIIKEVLMSEFN
jgi:serine/threonine protein kinase